jgi:hypothetical protein
MLVDPRRLLVILLAIVTLATAIVAASSTNVAALRAALPETLGASSVDGPGGGRTLPLREAVSGEPMLALNEARLEHDVLAAVRGSAGAGRATAPPRALASLLEAPGAAGLRRALDGIPRRELRLEAYVGQPRQALDTWEVEVLVDVRPIAGDPPGFATPTTEVTVELRPWGEPAGEAVTRWHVERVTIDRGGLFGLSRDIVYVRRGNVGVVAPTEERELAAVVAAMANELQPALRRRYRSLSGSDGAFIALVPTRAHVSRVYDEAAMPEDAIGTAYGGTRIAILLPTFRWDPSFVQRDLLRHELTHLATEYLARTWSYGIYSEGLAEWEGNHEIAATGFFYISNDAAVRAVQAGRVDLDALLFEGGGFEDLEGTMGYRLGMLVADYIEVEHGHARAVRFYGMLGKGVEPRVAVRRAFGTSPGAFREGVRAWMVDHRSWFG